MARSSTVTLTDVADVSLVLTAAAGQVQLKAPARGKVYTFESPAEIDELRDALFDLQLAAFPDDPEPAKSE